MGRPRSAPDADDLDVARAACHPAKFDGKPQTWMFFTANYYVQQQAIAICQGCEIREECLAGARTRHEQFGVWGGHVFHRGRGDGPLGRYPIGRQVRLR